MRTVYSIFYKIDNVAQTATEANFEIPVNINVYIQELIQDCAEKAGDREYVFDDTRGLTKNRIISIVKDENRMEKALELAGRLTKVEHDSNEQHKNLKSKIPTGILLVAYVDMELDGVNEYKAILAKADYTEFIEEVTGQKKTGLPTKKKLFKSFIAKAHVNYSKQMECSFQRDEETEWEISAKFKPLEDFNYKTDNNNTNKRNSDAGIAMSQTKQSEQPLYTMNEQKYLDSLKEFLEEDAEITVHERKMLDHIRQKLNISEERAKELEMSFSTPELTEDELEYLDMYREYAAKGVVTEKERRKLDKFAIVLGIEEKRIKEIEQLSKTD